MAASSMPRLLGRTLWYRRVHDNYHMNLLKALGVSPGNVIVPVVEVVKLRVPVPTSPAGVAGLKVPPSEVPPWY